MGQRLSKGQLTVVRYALSSYRDLKQKEAGLKRNATAKEQYESLMTLIETTIDEFDDDVKSVYVNH